MADPTPYVVNYSFAGFQANAPTTPLPGQKVDDELAGAATAIAALVVAIKDVRRSDGALQNNIVTFESLHSALQLTFDPTNGALVAAAVAGTAADRAAAAASAAASAVSATSSNAAKVLAQAAAASIDLTNYLPKSGNLAGLGSVVTARNNLGLGSAALLPADGGPDSVAVLDGSAKLADYDGSRLINIDTVRVGSTILFNGTFAPTGYVKENGALLSRVTYANLWDFANTSGNIVAEADWAANTGAFSTGDLATTFRLPDARGEFLRMWDNGRGVDSGRSMAQGQADANKAHTHTVSGGTSGATGVNTTVAAAGVQLLTGSTAIVIDSQGGSEARPRNIAKLACIKF